MENRTANVSCSRNDHWWEGYGQGGFICLPRTLLNILKDNIDHATFRTYVTLCTFHFEGRATFVSSKIATLLRKDDRAVRRQLADLETLGLISREPFGRGFKILFQCPTPERIREGAEKLAQRKRNRLRSAPASKAEAMQDEPAE